MLKEGILLELIPSKSKDGDIIQIEALDIKNNEIINRLNIRYLAESLDQKLIDMISYDKDDHSYLDSTESMLRALKDFAKDKTIYIMDNSYTKDYLKEFNTSFIEDFLGEEKDNFLERMIKKYNIQPTNYIVDILYESIILR